MAVSQGVRSTVVLDTETRRTRDVSPSVIQLEPDAGPLTTILMKLNKEVATDYKFEWIEDQLLPRFDILAANLTSSATTMTVTNYAYFRAGDIVRVNQGELILIVTTPSSTTVTIKRGFGETVAAAVTATATTQLHILSNCFEDGATVGSFLSTVRVPQYNYTQEMRHPFSVTNRNMATEQFGQKDLESEQAKQLVEHKKSIEYALILGERYLDTSATNYRSTTRGILKWISTNAKSAGGTFTEDEMEDFLRICFRYGSKKKMVICSPKLIQIINGFGRSKLQTRSDDSTYGITMTQYKNAGRVVELVENVLMTNDSLSDLSSIAGMGILVDIADLKLRYLQGALTVLKENIQDPSAHARTDEYTSDVGLQLAQEKKHGYVYGATD